MSASPVALASGERGREVLPRVRAFAEREALPVSALALYSAFVSAVLPYLVVQDSWLALVAGREVATRGLPSTESLTLLARDADWVDQQWLGQLALYGLHTAGGWGLLLGAHALLLVGTLATAVVAARRLGGSARAVAAIAAVGTLLAPWSWQVRPQSLAYPLFVVALWLLASDARRPSARVLFVLPLLVLWANVHGSVLVGAGLCAAAGVLALRARRGVGALLVAAPACALASPYWAELPGYYRSLLLDDDLRRYVVEWGWTAPALSTLPFYALAGLALWTLARRRAHLRTFDRLALALTLLAAASSLRSVVWFGLAALVLVPAAFPAGKAAPAARASVLVAAGLVTATVAVAVTSIPRAAEDRADRWPAAAAAAVTAGPADRVFASERHADWLLWTEPELRGRIAFDARFELLPTGTLARLSAFYERRGDDWRAFVRGYDVLALDPARKELVAALAAGAGTRVVYRDEHVVVLRRDTR